MLPVSRPLPAAELHAVPGQEFVRLCVVFALSCARRFRRRPAESVARSLQPHRQVSPYSQCQSKLTRAGRTERAFRRRNSPVPPSLSGREPRSLAGCFVSTSLNREFVHSDPLPGGVAR